MPNPTRRAAAIVALAAAIIAGAVALDLAPVAAQSDNEQAGRIIARRLDDGRTEFGWQHTGGARVLPRARYFPADARVDRWLNSSAVEVEGEAIGRINARLRSDGRIEFGFTPTDGERIEPRARYFPVDARVGRWLRSTEIAISAAPATGFVAISAGYAYECAIRAGSGAIECWGLNDYRKADAPAGSFSAVAAGNDHTCAIRDDGAIACWGRNSAGQTDAPTGRFTAVSVGGAHSCAIRAGTGAIACWGSNHDPSGPDPYGGDPRYIGQTDAPAGSFSAISAGRTYTCALRSDGAIECWGNTDYEDYNLTGRFIAVSAGDSHRCAIRDTGAIECWGDNYYRKADAPAGSFSAVSSGYFHTCAIRAGSGAIECWGSNSGGRTDAPTGRFIAVAAGPFSTCAIRAGSGAIECW